MLGFPFSLRDSAGNIDHGTLSEASANQIISVAGAEDISLNTSASDIAGYVRDGGDLILTTTDGGTLRLEGFFVGGEKELLLSENGDMTRVELDGLHDGVVTATYSNVDLAGKWSDYDQLTFLDLGHVEPVVAPLVAAPALFGLGGATAAAAAVAAGAVGVGVLAGGGSGGDSSDEAANDETGSDDAATPDTTAPDVAITDGVESTEDLVNGADYDDGTVTIEGTGEAGTDVEVTIDDTTVTTTVGDDGTWVADFDSDDLDEGEYTTDVTVTSTDDAGNSTTTTDTLVVDTEAEDLTFDTVEGDDVINIAEASDGVTISGTSEAGATVSVELEGQTVETTVGDDGTWSVSFDENTLPAGTYDSTVTATVTDAAGNVATYTHDVSVDLEASLTIDTDSVGGDGTVNSTELSSTVDISGTGEAGSTVVVTVAGVSQTTTISADGSWTVSYAAGSLPEGTYDAEVTAVSTDAAGNSVTSSGTFQIDTEVGVSIDSGHSGGDEIINLEESASPLSFSGTADAGSTVVVTLGTTSLTTVAGSDGTWSVSFDVGTLAAGEYDTTLTAVSTDEFGNTATAITSVTVDTVAGEVALSPEPIEGDNVINAVETADGVLVTGTATPGLDVTVTLDGVEHVVAATAEGTFSTLYSASEITEGEYDTTVTASITDAAGNSLSVSAAVAVDSFVSDFDVTSTHGGEDLVVNAAEAAAGVTLSGTVEAGSTVSVEVNGVSYAAVVTSGGTWSAVIPESGLPTGEGTFDATVSATDAAGNTAALVETIEYDTLVNDLSVDNNLGGDGVFNASEVNAGVTLTGTVEAGSVVEVTVQGVTQTATVDAAGNWSVTYAAGVLAEGEYTAEALVSATDAAGNTANTTASFDVDTVGETVSILGFSRSLNGISSVDVSETTDELSVFAIDEDGNASEIDVTVDDGELEFSSDVPNGSQIVVSSEDEAGNTADTLFVLDTGTTRPEGVFFDVDIDNVGLDGFDLGAVDLQFVNGGELTLSTADLDRITGDDGALTVHGSTDDRVVLTDTATADGSTEIDGQTYDIYTLGDEGTVFIDSDIEVVLP